MSYEFSQDQNELIGSLSSKMRLVGLVNVVLGVLYLISAVLLVVYIFQDRLPTEVTEKIPDEVRKQLPSGRHQWGLVIQTAVAGLILLMIGVWTRAAAASFHEIVATTGRDISHLMNALVSLHKMYALMYMLIVITALAFLIGLVLQLLMRFSG